jgi:hypothetical protein
MGRKVSAAPPTGAPPTITKGRQRFPMPTDTAKPAPQSRIPSRQELTRFYRAIGISAVASAAQAAKMTAPARKREDALPAFLRDAHAVG